ncbi:serine/threonine-protein kinase [Nonomuraea ferruginea]
MVHLGIDGDGREVAIKVLHPHVAADLKARDRLTREVETMRRVRSPHVAEVLDAELVGGQPYVVTRFAPGRTLEETVLSDGPLGPRQLITLAQGLCQALVAIHAADVIHRDFKPSNVMLADGEPLVIDFGIAHLVNATRLTQTGMFVGTPGYLAPEIIRDSDITQRADVHSLASTVFFAATGVPPFGTGTFEAVCFNIMEGRAQLDKAPVWLRGWLSRALQVDPADRPDARELLRMARALDPSVTTFNESPPEEQPGRTKRLLGRTKVMESFSDLLPPVQYGRPAREEKPPPYVPAPVTSRPPWPDQRVAGYPAPSPHTRAAAGPAPAAGPGPGAAPGLHAAARPDAAARAQALPRGQPVRGAARARHAGRAGGDDAGHGERDRDRAGAGAAGGRIPVRRHGAAAPGARQQRRRPAARAGRHAVGADQGHAGERGAGAAGDPVRRVRVGRAAVGRRDGRERGRRLRGSARSWPSLFLLPGGGSPRKAVTRTLTGVLRSPGAATVAVLVMGTVALFAVMFALGGTPSWEPWRAPETVIEELTTRAHDSATGLITGLVDDLMRELGLGFLSPWS